MSNFRRDSCSHSNRMRVEPRRPPVTTLAAGVTGFVFHTSPFIYRTFHLLCHNKKYDTSCPESRLATGAVRLSCHVEFIKSKNELVWWNPTHNVVPAPPPRSYHPIHPSITKSYPPPNNHPNLTRSAKCCTPVPQPKPCLRLSLVSPQFITITIPRQTTRLSRGGASNRQIPYPPPPLIPQSDKI